MKLTSLFSGSSGNCLLFEHEGLKLLVDAGVSGRRIEEMMRLTDAELSDIDGILITHEHDDHIAGVGILSRRYNLNVFCNEATYRAMMQKTKEIPDKRLNLIETDKPFAVKDVEILPFASSHDAADPVGYRFTDGHTGLAVATDLGTVCDSVLSAVCGCKSVFLESNHDIDMLTCGSYPQVLKNRILSDKGHLSNLDAAQCCVKLIQNGAESICLGHLSRENNTPLYALRTAVKILSENGIDRDKDYRILVARRDGITDSLI